MSAPARTGWFITYLATTLIAGCSAGQDDRLRLKAVPAPESYCLDAQQLVSGSDYRVWLMRQPDPTAFARARADLDGPDIQQYEWVDERSDIVAISCKLLTAAALNRQFGDGTAGPQGRCQDMNQAVFLKVAPRIADPDPAYRRIVFDSIDSADLEGMPAYTATWVDDEHALHIVTRERIEGDTQRCDLLAPAYFHSLLRGEAKPGLVIGRTAIRSSRHRPPCPANCRDLQARRPAAHG